MQALFVFSAMEVKHPIKANTQCMKAMKLGAKWRRRRQLQAKPVPGPVQTGPSTGTTGARTGAPDPAPDRTGLLPVYKPTRRSPVPVAYRLCTGRHRLQHRTGPVHRTYHRCWHRSDRSQNRFHRTYPPDSQICFVTYSLICPFVTSAYI